jgi:hypothetical protein
MSRSSAAHFHGDPDAMQSRPVLRRRTFAAIQKSRSACAGAAKMAHFLTATNTRSTLE